MIYADNAATTKPSERAINAALMCDREIYGNPSSLYSFGQRAKQALEAAREKTAGLLGARAGEIIFTSGGSESDNQAIISAARIGEKNGKKHIASTAFEHHAVLHTLDALKKQGFEVTLISVPSDGVITAGQVEEAIREDTCLVTVMYANNEIGTVQPIAQIGEVCRKKGVIFHTDAVQAAGRIPIDVKKQNIDMLSLSAHKFHGLKGAGVLYARKGIVLESLINGGAQERTKRAGTENLPATAAMAAAFEDAVGSIDAYNQKLIPIRNKIIDGLGKIPFSGLNGDPERRLANNISFCFEGVEGESLLLLLDDKGICASSGSACTSGSLEPSHVLLAIGRPHETAHGSLRLSLGEETSESEAEYIIKSVAQAVERLRSMSPLWRELEGGRKEHFFAK